MQREIYYDARALFIDIRCMLLTPELLTLSEIGNVLQAMTNSDRLMLLRYRPQVIRDCYDLLALLKYYIPASDRTLFACAFAEKMHHHNTDIMLANMKLIAATLPAHQRRHYLTFCLKVMDHIIAEKSHVRKIARFFSTATNYALDLMKQDASDDQITGYPACSLF